MVPVCLLSKLDGRYHHSHFIIIKRRKAKPSPRHSHPERESSLRARSFAYRNESPLRKTRRVKVSLSSCFNLVGGNFPGVLSKQQFLIINNISREGEG